MINDFVSQDTVFLPDIELEGRKEFIKESLVYVYEALTEQGYNPAMQIVGYLMSDDPTYITAHKNARIVASKLDRFEVLDILVEDFIKNTEK